MVGLAVGLHFYGIPPCHGRGGVSDLYAACFAVVCTCASAKRRKKTYLVGTDGATEHCKKS